MSFTVAADRMCSSPGQTLRFPGDGLSHTDPAAARGHHSGRVAGPRAEKGPLWLSVPPWFSFLVSSLLLP